MAKGQRSRKEHGTESTSSSRPPSIIARALVEHIRCLRYPAANASSWEGWADTIRGALKNDGVFDGLSPEQQQEFAVRISELWEIEGTMPDLKPLMRERKEWETSGARYMQKLISKTRAARVAADALRTYLKKLEVEARGTGLDDAFGDVLALFDVPSLIELRRRLPDLLREAAGPQDRKDDDAVVSLYDWLVERKVRPGEAEYRAAKISNECWDTKFTLQQFNSDGEKSRGCDAVRRRVERRRARDTSGKPS